MIDRFLFNIRICDRADIKCQGLIIRHILLYFKTFKPSYFREKPPGWGKRLELY